MERGLKVQVYRNLTKKAISVMALEGPNKGRIIARLNSVTLSNCRFLVNESGRQKVIKFKRKRVHAFVRGITTDFFESAHFTVPIADHVRLKYNPYKFSSFVRADNEQPVKEANSVMVYADGDMLALGVN